MGWFREYWYLLWMIGVVVAMVTWRMRTRPQDGPVLRRLLYALLPKIYEDRAAAQPLTARSAWIIGVGLVLVVLANLLLSD